MLINEGAACFSSTSAASRHLNWSILPFDATGRFRALYPVLLLLPGTDERLLRADVHSGVLGLLPSGPELQDGLHWVGFSAEPRNP